jgi:hypothetical protein
MCPIASYFFSFPSVNGSLEYRLLAVRILCEIQSRTKQFLRTIVSGSYVGPVKAIAKGWRVDHRLTRECSLIGFDKLVDRKIGTTL